MAKILIVDDSPMDQRLARGLLEKGLATSAVLTAADGVAATEILAREDVDLVVTDLQMPRMDGFELVRELQEHHPEIPVILMTAFGNEEIAAQALCYGAASYVPKECLAAFLETTVCSVLAASSAQRKTSSLLERVTRSEHEFVLENDPALIPVTIRYLARLAQGARLFDPSDMTRISIALEEALANAVYHGNLEVSSELRERGADNFAETARQRSLCPPYCERRVRVVAWISRQEFRCEVSDGGAGFAMDNLPDPTDPSNLVRPSGRGILLMRTFMDEVLYNQEGNQVTLVKRKQQPGARRRETSRRFKLS